MKLTYFQHLYRPKQIFTLETLDMLILLNEFLGFILNEN